MIRELQERTARALPAQHIEDAQGWWLRLAPGCSWWIGSVLPHGCGNLPRRVAGAERFYAGHGAVAVSDDAPFAVRTSVAASFAISMARL